MNHSIPLGLQRVDQRLVARGEAALLSPGRLFTELTAAKFSDEAYAGWLAETRRFREGLLNAAAAGLLDEAALIGARLRDLEWRYAAAGAEGLGLVQARTNLLLNEAWDSHAADLLMGTGSPTAWNNANARLGVGDSTTAASASQTDLQAASNKTYVGMDATYPLKGGAGTRQIIWRSSFTGANYAWQEVTLDNGASAAQNLFRAVSSLGTKATGTWTLTVTVTFS